MNVAWSRMLKSAYRKEPISSFIITVGMVDAVIGGVGYRWSLFAFGVAAVSIAVAFRWWRTQQTQVEFPSSKPIHYLTDRSSRPQLPMLNSSGRLPPTDDRR
ncbi:hypothetical protein IQ268_07535 [Oculatella sp. LEGE 06141]|uniref:hypothetical protein n=1 Tax=Oculatella sp. LEGE 06141 TaxID=1828648 RepID=UPI00187E2268|nr:hypothetical protein [Oculatella sp. LEGE 06141]MBE9178439.1 hypothetical protein [Oculatella sp. LEGE 06141]